MVAITTEENEVQTAKEKHLAFYEDEKVSYFNHELVVSKVVSYAAV